MRAFLRRLGRLLPHLCLSMSLAMAVFLVIDRVNNAMGFLEGDVFRVFLALYVLVAAGTAGTLLAMRSRRPPRP